jgi:hypothetical protein
VHGGIQYSRAVAVQEDSMALPVVERSLIAEIIDK